MTKPQKLYKQYSDTMDRALQSSYEHFDRAILTLSTGGLGLSILFINNLRPEHQIIYIGSIIIAWILFCISILATLLSFIFSQEAIKKYRMFAGKYYLEGKDEYFDKSNYYSIVTRYLNYFSGGFFLLAVISTLIFVSNNFLKGDYKMDTKIDKTIFEEKQKDSSIGGIVPIKMQERKIDKPEKTEGIVPQKFPKKPIEQPKEKSPNQPIKKK